MGVNSPYVGYRGWAKSDDILQFDGTAYGTVSTTYVEIITGVIIDDLTTDSELRFRLELKNDGVHTSTVTVYIGGENICDFIESNAAYQTLTNDEDVDANIWKRGAPISIKMKTTAGGQASMQNFSIRGKQSPMRLY